MTTTDPTPDPTPDPMPSLPEARPEDLAPTPFEREVFTHAVEAFMRMWTEDHK